MLNFRQEFHSRDAGFFLEYPAVDLKKKKEKSQRESCQLSFIGGRTRTDIYETAPQTALRNHSKDAGGKVSIYVILVKGEYTQSSTYFPRKFLLVS